MYNMLALTSTLQKMYFVFADLTTLQPLKGKGCKILEKNLTEDAIRDALKGTVGTIYAFSPHKRFRMGKILILLC